MAVTLTTPSLFILPQSASADSLSVNFEKPPYNTLGTINGQDGWVSLGSIGSGCAVYAHAVATNIYRYATFGGQSLRISDAATSGCFGDQTFAKPLFDSVGETSAAPGTFSPGTKQRHFETQFDIASTKLEQQPGMHVSFSPDRGDGSRMSYLRFEDGINGIDVFFDDVQGTGNPANFVETPVASGLNTATPHTVKLREYLQTLFVGLGAFCPRLFFVYSSYQNLFVALEPAVSLVPKNHPKLSSFAVFSMNCTRYQNYLLQFFHNDRKFIKLFADKFLLWMC